MNPCGNPRSCNCTARAREIPVLRGIFQHDGPIYSVAFTPDGKMMLMGTLGSVRMWDVASGKSLGASFHHQGAVRAIAFSLDGKKVLTGGSDRTARLWETATGKLLCAPIQHPVDIYTVALHPLGNVILIGGNDSTARLWDPNLESH